MKRVRDWRLVHGNWLTAFRAGDLRPHDYKVIISFTVCYLALFILMWTLYGMMDSAAGIMLICPAYYFTICLNLASTVIYQSRTFTVKELVLWCVINVLYILAGVLYWIA